jgi:hypothetical protein
MELWTEGQRTRWLTARQVLADLIEERGCKVREAASARDASRRVIELEAECSALIDLRHGLTMGDEDLIEGILTGSHELLVTAQRGGPRSTPERAEHGAVDA